MDQYKLIGMIIVLNIAIAFTSIAVSPNLNFSDFQTHNSYDNTQNVLTDKGNEMFDQETGMAEQEDTDIDPGTGGISVVRMALTFFDIFHLLLTGLITGYGQLMSNALSGTGLISAISWILGLFLILVYTFTVIKFVNNMKNKDSV